MRGSQIKLKTSIGNSIELSNNQQSCGKAQRSKRGTNFRLSLVHEFNINESFPRIHSNFNIIFEFPSSTPSDCLPCALTSIYLVIIVFQYGHLLTIGTMYINRHYPLLHFDKAPSGSTARSVVVTQLHHHLVLGFTLWLSLTWSYQSEFLTQFSRH